MATPDEVRTKRMAAERVSKEAMQKIAQAKDMEKKAAEAELRLKQEELRKAQQDIQKQQQEMNKLKTITP